MNTPRRILSSLIAFALAATPVAAGTVEAARSTTRLDPALSAAFASPIWNTLGTAGSLASVGDILKVTLSAPGVKQADIDAAALVVRLAQDPTVTAAVWGPLEQAGFSTQAGVIQRVSQAAGQDQQSREAFSRAVAPLQSTLEQAGAAASVEGLKFSLDKFFTNSNGAGSLGDPSGELVAAKGIGTPKIQLGLAPSMPRERVTKPEIPAPSADGSAEAVASRRSLKEQVLGLKRGDSSVLPHETGTHFVFKPNYEVVAKVPAVVTEAQMRQEKSMYSATVEFARKHGGPITRGFLDSVPDWYYAKAKELGLFPNIDVRVHDLNAHKLPKNVSLYPAIPGWHADGEFRETYFAQPNLQHVPVSFHIVGTVSTKREGVSNTQFLDRDFELDVPRADKDYTFWQQIHDKLEAVPNKPVSNTKDGDIVLFDARTLHRAMPTKNPGWRLFFRMSMWHKPNLGDGGQLSKQEQLYVVRDRPQSKATGPTKAVRFQPQVKVIGKVDSTAKIEDLAKEEGMEGASVEFAQKHGGAITRRLLDSVPTSFFEKAKKLGLRPTVDVLVYRLYPGYTPLIPNHESAPMMRGWHLDEPSPAAKSNADRQEIIASVSSHEEGVNHTQVLNIPMESKVPVNPTERAELWDAVDSSLATVAPSAIRTIQDGELVALSGSTLRRETVTNNRGWRLFFRISMQPPANVGGGRLLQFQYVDPSSESKGW